MRLLLRVLRPGGELLLAADQAQALYARDEPWTDKTMSGFGFSGPWNELRVSHRLPVPLVQIMRDFLDEHCRVDAESSRPRPAVQQQLELNSTLRWVQCDRSAVTRQAARAVQQLVADGVHPGDIAYLVQNMQVGRDLTRRLSRAGPDPQHTFPPDKDPQDLRRRKFALNRDRGKTIGTTVQSFRGWESTAVVLVLTDGSRSGAASAYVGMTRVRASNHSFLTVVSAVDAYDAFARQHFRDGYTRAASS